VTLERTDVSEELSASFIRVTRNGELETDARSNITFVVTEDVVILRSVRRLLVTVSVIPMKNGVFWVVTPCGSCKNRRFGVTWRLLHQGGKNR
jgi:hypothetical protein